jgi:hypothetical protein
MKRVASVLVMLVMVGVGRAGEKDLIERLEKAGVDVSIQSDLFGEKEALVVALINNRDADLSELCELHRLRMVLLVSRSVADAEMRTIGGLVGLRGLGCDFSAVTDAHLKQVGRLRKLKVLSLKGTRVTDAGLEELAGLADLELLCLQGTAVTAAGVARLQKALPNCKIYH